MAVFMIRVDYGKNTEAFRKNGLVAFGFLIDFPTVPATREEIEKLYRDRYPDDEKIKKAVNVGQLYRFFP